ncbi:unnamed protein product [Leptidea sinapis]|uniref:C2H2-type domain-containing protein n=1 Tax=Leptidea sinapis TaxID=189913 RepID=A0A5E4QL40_9NEOP|nr:unnamed protein product [Leptidea sinapis]
MLSPHEDDDDTHLCIKCNATVIGIDNYVKHRKERCGKLKNDKSLASIDPLEPTYSLGADVFFQSLELQSSVKKSSSLSRLTPPNPIYKTTVDTKTTPAIASTSRDIPRMSPLENNLRGEDWIGGHSLKIETSEDNQMKLIKAVASISGAAKKDPPSSSYISYTDYKGDDDLEESDDTEDEEEEEPSQSVKWKPPPNYTGGKWRPDSPDHDDWEPDPDTHDRDDDYDAPPPSHTKGKWVPGAPEKTQIMQTTIQSKGSVQYWCGPCNRRLGSRAIYDKHLMSNLHMRKVLPENELEFSGHLEPIRNVTEKSPDKRINRPSLFVNDSMYSQTQRKRQKSTKPKCNPKVIKPKRKRKHIFVSCSGCKSRVRSHLMGKHLISHYHFRKAIDMKSLTYRQLILDNMDAIVHQSPFQCSPCKFYTNWHSNFMHHWSSENHERVTSAMDGLYWCSFCKFECSASQEMLEHLSSLDHSEVVAVINRSMPILIRKKTIIRCETCHISFRYNFEAKQHWKKTSHELAYTATDTYQELHKCQHCHHKFKSSVTLCAHLKSEHKEKAFLCIVCSKVFNSSADAKQHRQTSEHRIRTKEKCYKCGKAFILSQEVTRHIRSNACQFADPNTVSTSALWSCSQCLFTTDSQAECFFHEILHSEPITQIIGENKVLKYACPLCDKAFKKKSLRDHLKQHTFERPFACSLCGANFTRQSSLNNHHKSKHEMPARPTETEVAAKEFRCHQSAPAHCDAANDDVFIRNPINMSPGGLYSGQRAIQTAC